MARRPDAPDYAARLARACSDAHARLGFGPEVRLGIIGPAALEAFEGTWRGSGRQVAWPWSQWVPDFRRRNPAAFHLALWHNDVLCGLSLGRAAKAKFVGVNLIEGNPDPKHALKGKVLPTVLTVAEFYRIQLGAPEMHLFDCNPQLIPLYETFGFELAPELGPHHMRRRS